MGAPVDMATAKINQIKGLAASPVPGPKPSQRAIVKQGEATQGNPEKAFDLLDDDNSKAKFWWIAGGLAVGVILVIVAVKYKIIKL